MPRPRKEHGDMIYFSTPWNKLAKSLAKALNNTVDADEALSVLNDIEQKLLEEYP